MRFSAVIFEFKRQFYSFCQFYCSPRRLWWASAQQIDRNTRVIFWHLRPLTTEEPKAKRFERHFHRVRSFTAAELPFQMNYLPRKTPKPKWCWIHKTKWFIHSNRIQTFRFIFNDAHFARRGWNIRRKKEKLECKIMRHNILCHLEC